MFGNLSALGSASNPPATGAAPTLGATPLFGAPASTSVPTTNPPSFGFSFPAATTSKPTAAANPVLSGMIGGPSTAKTTPSTGLGLGIGAPASTSAGLGAFKLPTATSQPASSNTLAFPSTGLSAAAKPGFSLPTASTTAATIGIKPLAVATSTAVTTAATNPLSLGTNPLAGFAKPVAAATTSAATTGFGLLGAGTSSAASTAPTAAAPSIFNKGLDGQVKTASLAQSSNKPTSSGDQNHDTKAVPAEIISQFTEFEKHIKSQKELSANKSTSSKDKMGKVRDQTTNMRQLLATVAMGLHRNVTALEKLKTQTKQSLYDAEMATGTRMMIESGAASAREYTAPDHYFYNLLESFDSRMTLYRRLIEDTEGYIVGAQQGATITPKDLFMCLKRLHETFIALAAQLQGIHEQIKIQKEQYLAYRKVFHNDDTDVFEVRRREMLEKAKLPRMSQPVGPSPFSGLSNYAAMMLTQAMQAPQQPPTVATGFGSLGQPSTTGLFGGGGGFGTTGITGGGMFGAAAAKPNPFAATTTQSTGLFGAAAKPTTGFGASTGFGTAATKPTSLFGAASSTATTGTAFGFPAATTKPSNPFGTTTTTPFGATKPLGLALPQTQSLGASAPTSAFNLQAPPNKRPL